MLHFGVHGQDCWRSPSAGDFAIMDLDRGGEVLEVNLAALEKEIEDALYRLMELEVEEEMIEMGRLFAGLLASVQSAGLIDFNLDVLVEPQECLPETRMLLESLLDVKRRFQRRRKLLTHRDILKIWLRKNNRFKAEFLPGMF